MNLGNVVHWSNLVNFIPGALLQRVVRYYVVQSLDAAQGVEAHVVPGEVREGVLLDGRDGGTVQVEYVGRVHADHGSERPRMARFKLGRIFEQRHPFLLPIKLYFGD